MIDHCGLPVFNSAARATASWSITLHEYAASTAIFKLSGFEINANLAYQELILEQMFQVLGREKLLFASNFPLARPAVALTRLQDFIVRHSLSADLGALVYANAQRFFNF